MPPWLQIKDSFVDFGKGEARCRLYNRLDLSSLRKLPYFIHFTIKKIVGPNVWSLLISIVELVLNLHVIIADDR